MKHLTKLVRGVHRHLADRDLLETVPFKVGDIRSGIQTLIGPMPIEFHAVDFHGERVLGRLEYYERSSGVYSGSETCALIKFNAHADELVRRFVQVKEMCHLWLDEPGSFTSTPQQYIELIERLAADGAAPMTADIVMERMAECAALEILFPQDLQQRFRPQVKAGALSEYRLSLEFGLPESVVVRAMTDWYAKRIVALYEAEAAAEAAMRARDPA